MSASLERRTRKSRAGGVLESIPAGAVVASRFTLDGQLMAELTDGRLVKLPAPTSPWGIRNGKVVTGPILVGIQAG